MNRKPIGLSVPYRKKTNTDHCVFKDNHLMCLHCGGSFTLPLPMDIKEMGQKSKAFIKLHEDCKKGNT